MNHVNKYTSIHELKKRRSTQQRHIAKFIYNSFWSCNGSFNQCFIFSTVFIWHCQKYLFIDFFDEIDEHSSFNEILTYPSISNNKLLNNFFQLFKKISFTKLIKAVKMFEEDNGEYCNSSVPHGFIASEYNVKQLLNNFNYPLFLNNNDISIIVQRLKL